MNRRSSIVLVAVLALVAVSCTRDPQKLKRQYVASGDKFVAQKNYPEAIIQYRNAVATDARFGEARFKLAEAYSETGDVNSALREYVRAADLLPSDVEAQLRAGNGLLAAGQFPDAKARALAALAKDPKNVIGLMLLGNALAGMKDLNGAITEVEEAIDADPHRTPSYANLGALELAKGNRQSAESAFKRAVDIDPKSASAHLGLANYYWSANQREAAEAELKIALQNEPNSPVANHALAVFYAVTNRLKESEQYLKRYAEVSPDAGPHLTLADFYLLQNRTPDAVAVLQQLLQTGDGFIPARIRLAAIDFVAGRRQQAYQGLDDVFKRDPKNELARLEKGRLLMAESKPKDALAMASAIVADNPNSIAGHYLQGTALMATGSMDDAMKAFQEVLRLSPSATAAELQLAQLNLARGDTAAAVEFASQVIKSQPQSVVAHMLMASAQLRLGNIVRAEPEVMALARIGGTSPEIHVLLGDLFWAKKDPTRAGDAYDEALKLRPGLIPALAGRVRVDLAQKKPDAARSLVASQLAKTPDDETLLGARGQHLPRKWRRGARGNDVSTRTASQSGKHGGLQSARGPVPVATPPGRSAHGIRGFGAQAAESRRRGHDDGGDDSDVAKQAGRGAKAISAGARARSQHAGRREQPGLGLRGKRRQPGRRPATRANRQVETPDQCGRERHARVGLLQERPRGPRRDVVAGGHQRGTLKSEHPLSSGSRVFEERQPEGRARFLPTGVEAGSEIPGSGRREA